MSGPMYVQKPELTRLFGWSTSTIWRRVQQGCFPCYRDQGKTFFDLNEVYYYMQGTRTGNFEQKGEACRSGRNAKRLGVA